MKLLKKNLQVLLSKEKHNSLARAALNWILSQWDDYENKEDIFIDLANNGCISGMVAPLIYYDDTISFYERHKEEINGLLYKIMEESGIYCPEELFTNWNKEDPLAIYRDNQNLLAWFAFEETVRNIGLKFEELEDKL